MLHANGLLVLVTAFTLLAPGCIGLGDEDDTAGTPATSTDGTTATTTTTATTDTSGASALDADPATPPGPPAPVVVPVTWDATIATALWVCVDPPVARCEGRMLQDGDHAFEPEFVGALQAAKLEMSWTPATPLTQTMVFGAGAFRECPEDDTECESWFEIGHVEGVSPLSIDASGLVIPPDATVHIWAGTPAKTPPPASVWLDTAQAIHVEGTLTVLPPATA